MQIDVRTNIKGIQKNLNIVEKSVFPLALAKALTFTAERIQKEQTRLIPQVFSNPIPKTRKSVFKKTANKNSLTAGTFLKDVRGEYKWMEHHIDGGSRPQKGSERAAGTGRIGSWSAMGKDAPRNQYGNITRATYSKMFADVQRAGLYSGDYANTKTKAAGGTKNIKHFMVKGKNGKNIIFKKSGRGGKNITPMLVETAKPTYRKRWPFYRVARSIAKRQFPILLRKSIDREVKKLKQPRVR